jgi:hypothetical protein
MKNADLRGEFGAHDNDMRQLLDGFPPQRQLSELQQRWGRRKGVQKTFFFFLTKETIY